MVCPNVGSRTVYEGPAPQVAVASYFCAVSHAAVLTNRGFAVTFTLEKGSLV